MPIDDLDGADSRQWAKDESLHDLFPTPVFCRRFEGSEFEAMNKDLAEHIEQLKQKSAGPSAGRRSVKSGFHGDPDFFGSECPAVKRLKSLIHESFQGYFERLWASESDLPPESLETVSAHIWGWSVVLEDRGGFSSPHVHPGSDVSGVYYVKASSSMTSAEANDAKEGWLAFCDPRPGARVRSLPGKRHPVKVSPIPGTLIMFPSYLEHFVYPLRGSAGERVSVAFNVALNYGSLQDA